MFPSFEVILNQIFVGLMTGMLYALLSVGLNLIFGVMRVISAAHGDLLMLGVYLTITISHFFGNPLLGLPLSLLVLFVIGFAIDRVLFLRLREHSRMDPGNILVMTLGLSIIISNTIILIWGPDPQIAPRIIQGVVRLTWISIATQRLLASCLSLVFIVTLFLFLKRSKTGIAIRAVAQNPEAAQAVGIDLNWINSITMGLSVLLAAAAGSLTAPLMYVIPAMGFTFTIKAWVVTVLGGLGSIEGALAASLILGVVESLSVLFIPVSFKEIVGLVIMILILLVKPSGLLGKERQ